MLLSFADWLNNVGGYIQTNPWMAIAAVFLGGVLSACAPCVLAMVPLMMSFVAGRKDRHVGPGLAFGYSLVFVLGLCITFVTLGMLAALAGQMYGDVSWVWTWVVVGVCLVMGLHLMDLLKFSIPMPSFAQPKIQGLTGALLLGLLFGFVSAPCAAPVLVVVLTYLAGSGSSVLYGGLLLLVYALGHSLLILVAGTSMGAARKLLESRRMARAQIILRRAAGCVIVLLGLFIALRTLI